MAIPKSMGIKNKDYMDIQEKKTEDDFKFDTNQKIQNLQFAIDLLSKSLDKSIATQRSDKTQYEINFTNFIEDVQTNLKEMSKKIDKLESLIKDLRTENSAVLENQKNLISLSYFDEKMMSRDCEIKSLKDQVNQYKQSQLSLEITINRSFEEKLKSLKSEILSIPSEIPELRKSLEQKLELVELNGQNSVVRSSNNERQIMLLERKYDNLFQLIKQLEITYKESK